MPADHEASHLTDVPRVSEALSHPRLSRAHAAIGRALSKLGDDVEAARRELLNAQQILRGER